MDKLGFQANSAQMIPLTKTPLRQRQMIQQGFQQHFQEAISTNEKLTISKHAQMRMDQRKIVIEQQTWDKIADKANEAKKMGVTESLIIIDNAALVISTKNNKVITVVDREEASSQIFTNINGTILIDK
ncbi:TIGR02530 family flagellar biosynthesis protein [Peribacillus butanolivorans]|uniref:Flagellar protein n=2 Tax=Peribacillus butanolivorans TaxID=421767 RepID=A0AAX0S7I5_9BACI|nr:TIGR02530 family flagellar biosynthesis protein [Peribacillus butanolivorans]AXN40546.1 flagellar protein [Peribacillus butanolivorans]PEJ35063.1 flagellar protein [Peribacillus butanolivorans]QNU05570.1 flagellar protein [Peribacillus butanolivorans]